LEQLPAFLKIKDSIYKTYLKGLSQIEGLSLAEVPNYAQNNHWMNVVQIDSNVFNKDRDSLMLHLEQNGIQTRPVWMLNHLQTPYKKCQSYFIEHAKYLISNSLCLPSSINLSLKQIKKIINIIDG